MIINIHAHVYARPQIKHPAGTPWMSVEEKIAIMEAKGIDKAVLLPLNNAENPAEPQSFGEILSICDQHPGRFIPFCNIDPRLPCRPDLTTTQMFLDLLGEYKELGAMGLGELTARVPWDDFQLDKMLAACEILELPVLFHTITPDHSSYGVLDEMGLPGLEHTLKRFPSLKIIGHSQAFWSEIGGDLKPEDKNIYPTGPVTPGGAVPRLLRTYPNLYGDISGNSGLNALTRDPEHMRTFIDEFQDKLIMGLDLCYGANTLQHIEVITQARKDGVVNEEAFEKLMWKNADKVLKLGLTGC